MSSTMFTYVSRDDGPCARGGGGRGWGGGGTGGVMKLLTSFRLEEGVGWERGMEGENLIGPVKEGHEDTYLLSQSGGRQ